MAVGPAIGLRPTCGSAGLTVAVVQHALAAGAGAAMPAGIVRTYRDRAAGRVSRRR